MTGRFGTYFLVCRVLLVASRVARNYILDALEVVKNSLNAPKTPGRQSRRFQPIIFHIFRILFRLSFIPS
jgi:hypothetical protein